MPPWRRQDLEPNVTSDLLGSTEDYRSAASINESLRRLTVLLASNRISPRRGAVLAYAFQLLLQSLSALKSESFELAPVPPPASANSPGRGAALTVRR